MHGKPVAVDGLFPQLIARADVEIDVRLEVYGVLPVLGEIERAGEMLRHLAPEALDRSVKPRVHDYAVAGGVILVHTFFVVRDEALGLGNFVFSVFEDVRPGGCAFLARGERERHRPAAGHGAGCEQRPCGQLHVADVRADREYRFTVYIFHLKAPLS